MIEEPKDGKSFKRVWAQMELDKMIKDKASLEKRLIKINERIERQKKRIEQL